MKKIIFLLIAMLAFTLPAYAMDDIICVEEESENSFTYVLPGTTYTFFKSFIKYVDSNGAEEYWIRVNYKYRQRLKAYIELNIDGETTRVWCITDLKHRHLRAGSGSEVDGNYNSEDMECYPLSKELIAKIAQCKDFHFYAGSQHKKGNFIKVDSNKYFLNGAKQIINLKYEDKQTYAENNVKVKI